MGEVWMEKPCEVGGLTEVRRGTKKGVAGRKGKKTKFPRGAYAL